MTVRVTVKDVPTCPRCGKTVVKIDLGKDAAGQDVAMRSCNNCGLRIWSSADQPVPRAAALKHLAAQRGRRTR